jgi:hypothetical protein
MMITAQDLVVLSRHPKYYYILFLYILLSAQDDYKFYLFILTYGSIDGDVAC